MLNMFSAYLSKKFRLGMLGDALLYGFVYAVILLGRIKNIDLGGVYRYKVYSIISHFL